VSIPTLPEYERISDYVHHYALETPTHSALVAHGRRIDYESFHAQVERCAKALLAHDVVRGDRVAMLCTPSIEFYVVYMATASIGGIWLGLNPNHRLDELLYVVKDARPRVLISRLTIRHRDYSEELHALMHEDHGVERLVTLEQSLHGLGTSFSDFLSEASRTSQADYRQALRAVRGADTALLVYTSGSTGQPKGAMLTHRGIVRCRCVEAEHWQVERPSTVVNLPINHIMGADEIPDYVLVAGGTIHFMEHFDALATLRLIEAERLTYLMQFPTQFQMMASLPEFDETDLSSLECIVWAGAPLSKDLLSRLRLLGIRLANAWGQTETSGEITFTDSDADFDVLATTVGRIDPRYDVRFVGPDGTVSPAGEAGEIQVRGDVLMHGYFARPEATREAIDVDGWLHTGDIGRQRADGNIELVGRLKEFYKSGGYNIYPREIEIVLEGHPAVAMAAVVGVPDPLYQEVGHGFVEIERGARLDEVELRNFSREHLANYKVPKQFTVSTELPKLSTGKIDKKTLARRARDLLKARDA
jgi:acyl-CoA synthetase (AMP-forming)/AMP-acid ligase II